MFRSIDTPVPAALCHSHLSNSELTHTSLQRPHSPTSFHSLTAPSSRLSSHLLCLNIAYVVRCRFCYAVSSLKRAPGTGCGWKYFAFKASEQGTHQKDERGRLSRGWCLHHWSTEQDGPVTVEKSVVLLFAQPPFVIVKAKHSDPTLMSK